MINSYMKLGVVGIHYQTTNHVENALCKITIVDTKLKFPQKTLLI